MDWDKNSLVVASNEYLSNLNTVDSRNMLINTGRLYKMFYILKDDGTPREVNDETLWSTAVSAFAKDKAVELIKHISKQHSADMANFLEGKKSYMTTNETYVEADLAAAQEIDFAQFPQEMEDHTVELRNREDRVANHEDPLVANTTIKREASVLNDDELKVRLDNLEAKKLAWAACHTGLRLPCYPVTSRHSCLTPLVHNASAPDKQDLIFLKKKLPEIIYPLPRPENAFIIARSASDELPCDTRHNLQSFVKHSSRDNNNRSRFDHFDGDRGIPNCKNSQKNRTCHKIDFVETQSRNNANANNKKSTNSPKTSDSDYEQNRDTPDISNKTCYLCKQIGHIKKVCPLYKRVKYLESKFQEACGQEDCGQEDVSRRAKKTRAEHYFVNDNDRNEKKLKL
jgi:hypothetical protein